MDEVIQQFGVHPNLFCDFQAIAGDAVDNIPGVRGIGPKISAALVNHFHSVDAIYDHINKFVQLEFSDGVISKIEANKILGESLQNVKASVSGVLKKLRASSLEELNLYKRLVTLDDSVALLPFHESVDSAANSGLLTTQTEGFSDLLDSLQREEKELIIEKLLRLVFTQYHQQKFTSSTLRYRGEKPHCLQLLRIFDSDMNRGDVLKPDLFESSLSKLRTVYHKLDRE